MTGSKPLGIRLMPSCQSDFGFRAFILIFTFFVYTSYHLARKPVSIVKSVLHRNCSVPLTPDDPRTSNGTECDWGPFDVDDKEASAMLGYLDLAYLTAYAIGMFLSGHIAERMDLRYFLSAGMVLSGLFTALFGMGYFWGIHSFWYYILVQICGGLVLASGWPSVVTCMANWFGKGKRGLIFGVWNSHTSVGNILGSLIAGIWVNSDWGWSFIVPGIIIAAIGIIGFLFLVPEPSIVGCAKPQQHLPGEEVEVEPESINQSYPNSVPDRISELFHMGSICSGSTDESTNLLKPQNGEAEKPITIWRALLIPGVIEFSLCLFFAKLVSYTFLFWLPLYIHNEANYGAEKSGDLSTLFDVGGIAGGIAAGVFSDYTGARASTCTIMLLLAAPMMFVYETWGSIDYGHSVGLLLVCGFFVNGPYALITTAVSADLGTHKSLRGNSKALATVTAIIDGTGSIGAAVGPLLAGVISGTGWNNVFWMLIGSDLIALMMLLRLVYKEIRASKWCIPYNDVEVSVQKVG